MERIDRTLSRLSKSPDFMQRYEGIKAEVMANQEIQSFLAENKDRVTGTMIEQNLMKLYEYMSQSKQCRDCPNLEWLCEYNGGV